MGCPVAKTDLLQGRKGRTSRGRKPTLFLLAIPSVAIVILTGGHAALGD